MAALMIKTVDEDPAPLRLVLGSDSYGFMRSALTERLAVLESQKDTASSTDFVD